MAWLAVLVALLLSGAMALAWRVALTTGQSGRIDAIWAFATGLAAVAAASASQGEPLRRATVCVMAATWSLRLGLYLWRRATSGGDDPRYAALKQLWGAAASRRLFIFLQIQAAASWPLALTAYCAAGAPRPALDWRDGLAIALFGLAFAGEAIADQQMAGFKQAPVTPEGARYAMDLGEFILPYRIVRDSADPSAAVREFLESTYLAAATLAGWDRPALERGGGVALPADLMQPADLI